MRILLKEAKRKAMNFESQYHKNSPHGNKTLEKDNSLFGGMSGGINKADNSLFSSINASLQKDVALLLSISDLNAHSLWLKTAHDRKKLIKEVYTYFWNIIMICLQ